VNLGFGAGVGGTVGGADAAGGRSRRERRDATDSCHSGGSVTTTKVNPAAAARRIGGVDQGEWGHSADCGAAVPGAAAGAPQHEIVAGERRWQAAKLAGLTEIPVVIRELSDSQAVAVALIENIQREELTPAEEARALQRLIAEFSLTHQEAADAVGRSARRCRISFDCSICRPKWWSLLTRRP